MEQAVFMTRIFVACHRTEELSLRGVQEISDERNQEE